MSSLVVLYDACVLYPAPLRDLLMHLAITGFFQAKSTESIHDEWIRNVLKDRPDLTREQLQRTRELMDRSGGDCLVENYEDLIPSLRLPDPNDRHVLAAAIHAQANVIITFNLKDFPHSSLDAYEIDAQHPDAFTSSLLEMAPEAVCMAVRRQRASLKNPPKSVEQLLATYESQALPILAGALRSHSKVL